MRVLNGGRTAEEHRSAGPAGDSHICVSLDDANRSVPRKIEHDLDLGRRDRQARLPRPGGGVVGRATAGGRLAGSRGEGEPRSVLSAIHRLEAVRPAAQILQHVIRVHFG